ncbi:helix-turn-helix transcriptional regulator [Erwinia aphidicola]|nr:helix-turn-helix transcriptional regulator [Erwinia aphidicola]
MNKARKSKLEEIIQPLIQFWEHSEDPWAVKDNKSQYVYANSRYLELASLPVNYKIEGHFDDELPNAHHVDAPLFQQQDRMVERKKDRVTVARIYQFNRHSWFYPWYFDKFPITDGAGICLGTFSHCRPVENIIVNRMKQIKIRSCISFNRPSEIFTEREWELVFYVIQAFSSKDIGSMLGISSGTVDNSLNRIYLKCGVSSRRELIDYCIANNFDNYVPKNFFCKK